MSPGASQRATKTKAKTRYGIRAVSQLTGISAHLLRMWERRYELGPAERTDSGRRQYSLADVQRLTLIRQLLDRGEAIGQIAALPAAELAQRLETYDQHIASRESHEVAPLTVAVWGDYLPTQVGTSLEGANVVVRETGLDQFRVDIKRLQPDALVLELPILGEQTKKLVGDLKRQSGARRTLIVYTFARREDADLLADDATVVLRAPVTTDEIARMLQASRPSGRSAGSAEAGTRDIAPATHIELEPEAAPARRFTRDELARLAAASTRVECECPTHLVDLVVSLSAFELYSADCESRNAADAALHAYLHATSAKARSMIEAALERVAQAEGLL